MIRKYLLVLLIGLVITAGLAFPHVGMAQTISNSEMLRRVAERLGWNPDVNSLKIEHYNAYNTGDQVSIYFYEDLGLSCDPAYEFWQGTECADGQVSLGSTGITAYYARTSGCGTYDCLFKAAIYFYELRPEYPSGSGWQVYYESGNMSRESFEELSQSELVHIATALAEEYMNMLNGGEQEDTQPVENYEYQPSTQPSTEVDSRFPYWILILFFLGLLPFGALPLIPIAKKNFGAKPKTRQQPRRQGPEQKQPEEKPQKQYRLTASAQFLRFKPGDRRKLTVIAEVSKESGGWARAGNIPIQLRVSDGFSLTEDQGNGSVETAVIAKQADQPTRGQLTYAGFTSQGGVIPPQTVPLEIVVPDYQIVTNLKELLIPAGSQKTLRAAGMQRTPDGQLTPVEVDQFSFTLLQNETPNRVDVSQQGTTGTAHIIPKPGAFSEETRYQILVEATFPDGTTASTRVPVRISPVQYELVAESESLQLIAGERVACRVIPYVILPSGQKEIANDLYLHVEASPGLQASPFSVQGVLDLTIEGDDTVKSGKQTLGVVSSHALGETRIDIPVEVLKLVPVSDDRIVIPYNPETDSWDTQNFSAHIEVEGDGRVIPPRDPVHVDDSPGSPYPGLEYKLLKLQETHTTNKEVQITLVYDGNSLERRRLLRDRHVFRLCTQLQPDFGTDHNSEHSTVIEAETEVLVERPIQLKWSFRKTNWLKIEPLDLLKIDEIQERLDDVKKIFTAGGKIIIRPRAILPPRNPQDEPIKSPIGINHAEVCTLEIGLDETIEGLWDSIQDAYVFEIKTWDPKSDSQPTPLIWEYPIEIHQTITDYGHKLLKFGSIFAERVKHESGNAQAKIYLEGFLQHVSAYPLEKLESRAEDLKTWLNNVTNFITALSIVPRMFDEALRLFSEAFARFQKNFVDFILEVTFFAAGKAVDKFSNSPARVGSRLQDVVTKEADRGIKETTEEMGKLEKNLTDWNAVIETQTDFVNTLAEMRKAGFEVDDAVFKNTISNYSTALSTYQKFQTAYLQQAANKSFYAALKNLPKTLTKDEMNDFIRKTVRDFPESPAASAAGDQIRKAVMKQQPDLDEMAKMLGLAKKSPKISLERIKEINQTLQLIKEVAMKKVFFDTTKSEIVVNQLYKKNLSDQMAAVEQLQTEAREDPKGILDSLSDLWSKTVSMLTYYPKKLISYIVENLMTQNAWSETSLKDWAYSQGVSALLDHQIPSSFLFFPNEFLKDMIRQDVTITEDQRKFGNLLSEMSKRSKDGFQAEKEIQERQARTFLVRLYGLALDHNRLDESPPPAYNADSLKAMWRPLYDNMIEYRNAFAETGQTGFDPYLNGKFCSIRNWQDIDRFIEDMGWAVSWILKIVSVVGLAALGAGWAFGVAAYTASEYVDLFVTEARGFVSYLGTMPTATGFQVDTLVSAYWLYSVAITGEHTDTDIFE